MQAGTSSWAKVVTLLAMLLAASSCARREIGSSTGSTGRPVTGEIVVGVLAPKSGFMSGHGNSIDMGARLAEAYVNSHGGVRGTKLRIVVRDTTSDPSGAAERAKELIQRDGAQLLVGTGTSASTLAVIPISTTAHVPFIYSLDGECKTCSAGSPNTTSHFVWGSGFTERMAVPPMLRYLAGRFRRPDMPFKIYFVGGDYVYPRTTNAFARQVATTLGLTTVGEEYSDTSTRDYAPVIRRILAAQPDLVIVTNPGASGVTFMKQARQLGLPGTIPISGFATFDQEAIDAMGDASEGVFCVNRYSNELPNAANNEFVSAFRRAYPTSTLLPGPTAAAGAYGSILVAAEAFRRAGGSNPDRFYEAMKGLSIDLPQGHVVVDASNNIFQQPLYIMQIRAQHYHVIANLGNQVQPDLQGCSVK